MGLPFVSRLSVAEVRLIMVAPTGPPARDCSERGEIRPLAPFAPIQSGVRILFQPSRLRRLHHRFNRWLAAGAAHPARVRRGVLSLNSIMSPEPLTEILDVIIVGGGAAGLSAALVLGRCLRKVLVFDAGSPRNAPARIFNGYLSRDGSTPGEFLQSRATNFGATKLLSCEHRRSFAASAATGRLRSFSKVANGSNRDYCSLLRALSMSCRRSRI